MGSWFPKQPSDLLFARQILSHWTTREATNEVVEFREQEEEWEQSEPGVGAGR